MMRIADTLLVDCISPPCAFNRIGHLQGSIVDLMVRDDVERLDVSALPGPSIGSEGNVNIEPLLGQHALISSINALLAPKQHTCCMLGMQTALMTYGSCFSWTERKSSPMEAIARSNEKEITRLLI